MAPSLNPQSIADTEWRGIVTKCIEENATGWCPLATIERGGHQFNVHQDLGPISTWDVSGIRDFSNLFEDAHQFNQNLSTWVTTSATAMNRMFTNAAAFDSNIGKWSVSGVGTFRGMFQGATSFNQELSGWTTTAATTMENMFKDASAFDQNLGHFVLSSVSSTRSMFEGASSFNRDIGGWDMSQVTDVRDMFKGAIVFAQALTSWSLSAVTSGEFAGCVDGATAFHVYFTCPSVTNGPPHLCVPSGVPTPAPTPGGTLVPTPQATPSPTPGGATLYLEAAIAGSVNRTENEGVRILLKGENRGTAPTVGSLWGGRVVHGDRAAQELDLSDAAVAANAAGMTLAVAPGALRAGEIAEFTLTLSSVSGVAPSSTSVNITINAGPTGGTVSCSTLTATAIDTSVQMSTSAWNDADQPLMYRFGYLQESMAGSVAVTQFVPLTSWSAASSASAVFPAGSFRIAAQARDSRGAVCKISAALPTATPLIVSWPVASSASEAVAIASSSVDKAKALLDGGDVNGALQLAEASTAYLGTQSGLPKEEAMKVRGSIISMAGASLSGDYLTNITTDDAARSVELLASVMSVASEISPSSAAIAVQSCEALVDATLGGNSNLAVDVSMATNIGLVLESQVASTSSFSANSSNASSSALVEAGALAASVMDKVGRAVLITAVPGDPPVKVALKSMQMMAQRSSSTASDTFTSSFNTSDGNTTLTLGAGVQAVLSALNASQGVDIHVATYSFATHDPGAIASRNISGSISGIATIGSGVTSVDLRLPGGNDVNLTGLTSPLAFSLPLDPLSGPAIKPSNGSSSARVPSCHYWDVGMQLYSRAGCVAAPNPRPAGAIPKFVPGLAGSSAPRWVLSGLDASCVFSASWNESGGVHIYTLAGEKCIHIMSNSTDGDANVSDGCEWDSALQAFVGSACELSLSLECGCDHATDYAAVLEPPKLAKVEKKQLLPPFSDVMQIWRLVASFAGLFVLSVVLSFAFHKRDKILRKRNLEELFQLSNGHVRGPDGEWTWYFYELMEGDTSKNPYIERERRRQRMRERLSGTADPNDISLEDTGGLTGVKGRIGPAVLLCSVMGIPYNRLRMAVPPEVLKLRVPFGVHEGILPNLVFDEDDAAEPRKTQSMVRKSLASHEQGNAEAGKGGKLGKSYQEAHAARLVGTAMAFAFLRIQRLVPAHQFRFQMLRAAQLVDGGSAEPGRGFHELFDVFYAMLSDGNINSPGWFARYPIWQLLFMCRADGSWQSSESLAHAVWALDSESPGSEVPTNAHLFDVSALDRAMPEVLRDLSGEVEAKGYVVSDIWATLLAVAFLDFQHETYTVRGEVMARAHSLNSQGEISGSDGEGESLYGPTPMSELGANWLHFAGDLCPSLGELLPSLLTYAEGCVSRWQRAHSTRVNAFLDSEDAKLQQGTVAWRNTKNVLHRALALHQVLNVLVAPPHGDGFPRSMRILTITAAWGTALATAIWLAWNRMQLCCDMYYKELDCAAAVAAYGGAGMDNPPFCVVQNTEYETCGALQIGGVALPRCDAFPDPSNLRDIVWVALLTFVVCFPLKKILTSLFFMANSDQTGSSWAKKDPAEKLRDTFELTLLGKQLDVVDSEEREEAERQGKSSGGDADGSIETANATAIADAANTNKQFIEKRDEYVEEQRKHAEGLEAQEKFKSQQTRVHQVGLVFGDVMLRAFLIFIASLSVEKLFPCLGVLIKIITCSDDDSGGGGDNSNRGEEVSSGTTRVDMDASTQGVAAGAVAGSMMLGSGDGRRLSKVHVKVQGWKVASAYRAPLLQSIRGLTGKLEGLDAVDSHKKHVTEGGTFTHFPIELVSACTFLQLWWRMMREGLSFLFYSLLERACTRLGLSRYDVMASILYVIDMNGDGSLDVHEFGFLSTLGDLALSPPEDRAFFVALCKLQRDIDAREGQIEGDIEFGSRQDSNGDVTEMSFGLKALEVLIFAPPRRSICVTLEGESLMSLSRVHNVSPSRLGQLNEDRLMSEAHRATPRPMFALTRSVLPVGSLVLLPAPIMRGPGLSSIIALAGLGEENLEFERIEANQRSLEIWLHDEEKRLNEKAMYRRIGMVLVSFFLICLWGALTWSVVIFGLQLYTLIGDGEEFAMFVNFLASLVVEIFILEWQRIVVAIFLGVLWAYLVTALGGPDEEIRRLERHYDELSRLEQMEVAKRLATSSSSDSRANPGAIIERQFKRTQSHESGPGG